MIWEILAMVIAAPIWIMIMRAGMLKLAVRQAENPSRALQHRMGTVHWDHEGCRRCVRYRTLRDLPGEDPRRPDPAEISALHDQVMGPISDVVAAAEQQAQAEWDAEHAPKPTAEEKAAKVAALKAEEQARADKAAKENQISRDLQAATQRVPAPLPYDPIALYPAIGSHYVHPLIPADDPAVLRAERKILVAELERMTWSQDIPSSNRKWNSVLRQVEAIDAQIRAAFPPDGG